MQVIEFSFDGVPYVAMEVPHRRNVVGIGDDATFFPVFRFIRELGEKRRQLTPMRWPHLTRFAEPESIRRREMSADAFLAEYGEESRQRDEKSDRAMKRDLGIPWYK